MKELTLKYDLECGILSLDKQYKILVEKKIEKKPLPDNWKTMINNYLFVKTQHENKLKEKLKKIEKDISDSYHVLEELKNYED